MFLGFNFLATSGIVCSSLCFSLSGDNFWALPKWYSSILGSKWPIWIKYFIKKGGKISENAVNYIIQIGDLDLVKYIVDEKGATLGDDTVDDAVKSGNLDLVKYIVDDKNKPISEDDLLNAARFGNLPIVKYFIHEKGQKADEYVLDRATRYRHQHVVNYLNSVMNKN